MLNDDDDDDDDDSKEYRRFFTRAMTQSGVASCVLITITVILYMSALHITRTALHLHHVCIAYLHTLYSNIDTLCKYFSI